MFFPLNNISFSSPLTPASYCWRDAAQKRQGQAQKHESLNTGTVPPVLADRPCQPRLLTVPHPISWPGQLQICFISVCLSFPICLVLLTPCKAFLRTLEGGPSYYFCPNTCSMGCENIWELDITSTQHSPPEEQSPALLFPFSFSIRQQNPLKSSSHKERQIPAV